MEEEKAAAYYEELTRKGQSAARFKQGLGFSSSSNSNSNYFPSNSSTNNPPNHQLTFVKATTSPSVTCHHKQSQLLSIHNKLTQTKPLSSSSSSSSSHKDRDRHRDRDRDRDREDEYKDRDRNRDRGHRRRSCSRDRYSERRRSKSRSDSDGERRRMRRMRRRSVSRSPENNNIKRGKPSAGLDYAKLIHGYGKMSPAERVKAKMKFQLTETAEKDTKKGMGSGWERFEFDKDAPLDDEEMEVADDDVALVKHIGQSFRFSAVEANRDDKIKAAHNEAMFGTSGVFPSIHTEGVIEHENESKVKESTSATSLLSDKVIAGQQGSWRDRARKA